MRFFVLIIIVFSAFQCLAQESGKTLLSGIIVSTDSIPVTDVAIINTITGKTVRTNSNGFFQIEIADTDSLLVFHIAYQRKFITAKNNGETIVLEPKIQELMQVDVTDKKEQQQKNLDETVSEIKRLAPMEKLSGYELHSMQEYFIREQGSHGKGFSPFFGPTVGVPLGTITDKLSNRKRRQLKKLTSHYHLIKQERE